MESTAYLPDLQTAPLDLERVIETRVADLQHGDVIAQQGFIPLIVNAVMAEICGLTSIEYLWTGGVGTRVYPTEMVIQVRRRVAEAAH